MKAREWNESFGTYPAEPGTEALQKRHKQLCMQRKLSEAEEAETTDIFLTVWPAVLQPYNEREKG